MSNIPYAKDLRAILASAVPQLLKLSVEKISQKPAPNKWSPKEIIGHLIDSASNNHQRFVRANLQEDFIFLGYQQDDWVNIQQYQLADWQFLVTFWQNYNLHIANLMDSIPEAVRLKVHNTHNLHQIEGLSYKKLILFSHLINALQSS